MAKKKGANTTRSKYTKDGRVVRTKIKKTGEKTRRIKTKDSKDGKTTKTTTRTGLSKATRFKRKR